MEHTGGRFGTGSFATGRAALALALAVGLAAPAAPAVADEGPPAKDGSFVRPVAAAIRIAEPEPGRQRRPPERVTVFFQREERELLGSSVELWIDGVEHTEALRFWVDRAWLELPPGFWSPGPHRIETSVRDASGAMFADVLSFELPHPADEPEYQWPFDYAAPNVVANLMEDYQRFGTLPNPPDAPYWHHGLDIRAPAGSEVRPVIGGYIAYKGCYAQCSSLQRNVTVLGDDDLLWQYSHLNHGSWTDKQVGDRVEPADVLGSIVNWPSVTNGANYHHLHLNAVEWEGFDVAAWRAMAEDPEQTPPAVAAPLSPGFEWHNPLLFLASAGDQDTSDPQFDGELDAFAAEILFLDNESEFAQSLMNDVVSGDVDIAAHLMDTRDLVEDLLVPGQPYTLGLYEIAYSVVPVETECFKGWIPRTKLATFDVVPGGHDADLQDELLLDVFQETIHQGGATWTTSFEYHQRNFWYNVTNAKWGLLDSAAGYWNTDGATIQGPLFLDGTYRVTVYAEDFSGNEIAHAVEVEVDNDLPANGGYCPTHITHLALPDVELEPEGGGVLRFAPPPIPIAFDGILEGSSRTAIPAAGWPAWTFDDTARGLRVAIGVLDGREVEVEYVPYLGDVILEVPAEVQVLPIGAAFDPHAPSLRPLALRISTRLARDPWSGVAIVGAPHGLDQVAFDLAMAEPVQVLGEDHLLRTVAGGSAAWILEGPSDPGTPPVPDGRDGAPMTVRRNDAAGSSLDLSWDVSTCPGGGYDVIYGSLHDVGSLAVEGSACGLGTSGAATWDGVPAGDLWFVLVSDNGAGTEGSWGLGADGAPRGGSSPSGQCGNTARSNAEECR